ncbi:MAG: extracellular solute-binding protein [Candidatus Colwellbacteria bacterium]|nr:extracellular solute-binding protein [Candidatus Colwellbacteria bacterium]
MRTQFTQKQTIFLAIAGVIALVVVLMFVGVIPGKRTPKAEITQLELWGVDNRKVWEGTISRFRSVYPVEVKYKRIDPASYEKDVVNALAAGEGPDIFMFDNNWLLKHEAKIIPAPSEKFSLATLQSLFPQAAEQDFVLGGEIYALPLYIDTLILAYNRDHFDQGGITAPPATWTEFDADIPALKKMNGVNIERAAFAVGGTSPDISNAPDLLNLFVMQSGVTMINDDLDGVLFNKEAGQNSFSRYVSYANPNLPTVYTWNNALGKDAELFARNNVSGVFIYSSQLDDLRSKNTLINTGVAAMPQVSSEATINYPNYFGLAVANSAEDQGAAWDFVIFATTDQTSAEEYFQDTDLPPALRSLIDKYKDDTGKNGILARQALTARSWLQPDEAFVRDAFNGAIGAVLDSSLNVRQAFNRLSIRIKDLLEAR